MHKYNEFNYLFDGVNFIQFGKVFWLYQMKINVRDEWLLKWTSSNKCNLNQYGWLEANENEYEWKITMQRNYFA